VGEDSPGGKDVCGIQGGQVPLQVRAVVRGTRGHASIRRKICRIRDDPEHSGMSFYALPPTRKKSILSFFIIKNRIEKSLDFCLF
jgi:hypothetical protein